MVNWLNPYEENSGKWLKGSLHTHCSEKSPCALMPLSQLLEGYANAGFDFISISDHLNTTDASHSSMCIIPGMEWNSRGGMTPNSALTRNDHVGIYALNHKSLLECLRYKELEDLLSQPKEEMLRVLNHPDWLIDEHYDIKKLMRLLGKYDGIEIYNSSVEMDSGQADSTWKWDYLLSMGNPVLGFASDDSHTTDEIGFAWLMVRAKEKNARSIFDSLRAGNFYCSTGVTISKLERAGSVLSISTNDDTQTQIRVIGDGGRLLDESIGTTMTFDFDQHQATYVRIYLRNSAWQQAWTQPFFMSHKD